MLDKDDDEGDQPHESEGELMSTNHSDHLLKMITASGESARAWLKFLITTQGALAVGFGYLAVSSQPSWMQKTLALIICAMGGILADVLIRTTVRHHHWHAWFIKRYVALPGNLGKVFPGEVEPPHMSIDDVPPGRIAKSLRMLRWALIIGWVIAAIVALTISPLNPNQATPNFKTGHSGSKQASTHPCGKNILRTENK